MPETFTVMVIDRATDQPVTLTVSANTVIRTQADAERHVLNMPTSQGGKHPGFELAKPVAATEIIPPAESQPVK